MSSLQITLSVSPSASLQAAVQSAQQQPLPQPGDNDTQAQVSSDNGNDAPRNAPRNDSPGDSNGNSQFSRLLVSKQGGSNNGKQNPAPQAAQKQASAPQGDDNQVEQETVSDDSDADVSAEAAPIISLLIQLQTVVNPKQPQAASRETDIAVQAATDATPAQTGTGPTDDDALRALMDELRSLLMLMLQSAQTAAATGAANAGQTPAVSTDGDALPETGDTGGTEDAASSLASLIQSLLVQLQGEGTAAPASATQEAGLVIASNSEAASPDLLGALKELAALLNAAAETAKTPATGNAAAPQEEAAPAALTLPAEEQPAQTEKAATDTTAQKQSMAALPDRHALEHAVARVVDALASKTGRQDDDSSTNTSGTTPNTPHAAAQPSHQPQETSFAKTLQQAAPQPQVPVQDQVVVQIRNAITDGSSQIRIQLHPEELGKVDVQITTTSEGKTGVTITADNRHTLAMLQNEARALTDSLRDIGLKTDAGSLNFNLRDSQQDARNSSRQQQGGYTQVAGVGETDEEEYGFSTAGALYRLSVQQGLDIRV